MQCLKLLLQATNREAAQDWCGAITALRTALGNGMAAEDRDVWANLGNMALHLGDDAAHRAFFAAPPYRAATTMTSCSRRPSSCSPSNTSG